MAIVTETITITTTGANAGVQNYSVQVDTTTGASVNPLSVPIIGTAAGTSSVIATMPSHVGIAPSNTAEIAWQATSGLIAVTPFTINAYSNGSQTRGWPGLIGTPALTPNCNALDFNQVNKDVPLAPFCEPTNNSGCAGGYKTSPMLALQQTVGGAWASNTTIQGASDIPFVLNFSTNLVVKTAGTYTFYMLYANVSSTACWIGGGATFSSVSAYGGNSGNAFPALSPKNGYPLAIAATNMGVASHPNAVSSYITFPAPGIYPMEIVYNQFAPVSFGGENNSFWQLTYLSGAQNQNIGDASSGSMSLSVALATAPPAGPPPTGALRLTPTGGAAGLKVQGQTDTLTLTVQQIAYASIPYVPILEGTAGSLFVYNFGTAFTFQTYNGFNPGDTTLTANAVFSITGANTSGIFNVTPQSSYFLLNYTGGTFSFIGPASQIASTDLTLTADDIAWFDGTAGANSFDLFSPVGNAGGISYSIDVDFMTRPTVQSVSPSSLNANGTTQPITINLSQPMSPEQQGLYGTGNTVVPSATLSGGATFGSPLTPVLNNGFLTGYSTSVFVPISSSNGSITLTFNLDGTLTFLSGTTFITKTYPNTPPLYINGSTTVISTVGNAYVPPVAVSLTVANGSTPWGLGAIIYTFDNNPVTLGFQHKSTAVGASAVNVVAPVTLVNSYTGVVGRFAEGGGQTVYYKVYSALFTPPSEPAGSTSQLIGFVATDTVSGLSVTYFSTTVYEFPLIAGGGGGGGGGACPALEMFVDEWHQVSDVFNGMGLDTLAGEVTDYLDNPILTEVRQVERFDFSTEVCYELTAANGAQIIVSSSTPVPTRESIESIVDGMEDCEIKHFANEVIAGMHVITEIDDMIEWSPLVDVTCVGMRRVARLYCGGRNFAAGSRPGKYIYTHNIAIAK